MDFTANFEEALIAQIKEANGRITHEDFADGVNNGAMGFKMMFGEPNKLLYGSRKVFFNVFVLLYLVAPFIIIPILAYFANNWWLLLGIGISLIFTHFATWGIAKSSGKWKSKIIGYFFVVFVINWVANGFHFYNYITFFFFCAAWATFFFLVAEQTQNDYALQILKENKKVFDLAIQHNQIMIIHKDKIGKEKKEDEDYNKSSSYLDKGDKKFNNADYNGAIIEYSKSIEIYPMVSTFGKRADAKIRLENYEGAIFDYTEAINRMPDIPNRIAFANYYRNRGEAKLVLNLTKEAQLDFLEADKLINK
jgi:tetratricopeptide (TPR) repeat protein